MRKRCTFHNNILALNILKIACMNGQVSMLCIGNSFSHIIPYEGYCSYRIAVYKEMRSSLYVDAYHF